MKTTVTVSVDVPWVGGSKTFYFPISVYLKHRADVTALILARIGVSEYEYKLWLEADGRVECIETLKSGKKCRAHVTSIGVVADPTEWVKLSEIGGYCKKHGGE